MTKRGIGNAVAGLSMGVHSVWHSPSQVARGVAVLTAELVRQVSSTPPAASMIMRRRLYFMIASGSMTQRTCIITLAGHLR